MEVRELAMTNPQGSNDFIVEFGGALVEMKPLLERIEKGQIDPSYIISHRITLDEAPEMYKVWRDKKQNVTKIVIDPWAAQAPQTRA
ncbi:MAG: hypothetical protein ACRD3Q_08340 [Terriglobales bacterium]